MRFVFPLAQLLRINSDNAEIQKKGRLLQSLVLVLTLMGLARAAMAPSPGILNLADGFLSSLAQGMVLLLVGLLSLLLARNGRLQPAAHLYFVTLNAIFFVSLITSQDMNSYPYLMLISVVAIAALDSVRASAIYAIAIVTAVLFFYSQATSEFTPGDVAAYILTATGISITTWITASDLQQALRASRELTQELQNKTGLLHKRAQQLQRSAEVGHISSVSLDLDQLLHNTVYLIRDQFDFYHVSIFLFDEERQRLVLREAAGGIGERLKARGYELPMNTSSIIGWVATNREARIALDVGQDPIYKLEPLLAQTRSELSLPLIAHGRLLGVLDVQSRQPDAFEEEDISILQIMANQVAVNIDNAHLFAQTEARLNETRILLDLNASLTATLDAHEIYRRAAHTFVNQLEATHCTISSWQPESGTITLQAELAHDLGNDAIEEYSTDHKTQQLGNQTGKQRVLQQQETIVRHVQDSNLDESERKILAQREQSLCLEIPLVRGHETIGSVELYRNGNQPAFTEAEIQLGQAMANQTAVVLDIANLTSEMQERVAQLSTLNRLSTALSLAPSLKDIFEGARREVLSLIDATGMSISLLTPEGDKLHWIYGFEHGQEVDLSDIPPFPISRGFSGHVATTREVLFLNERMEEMQEQLRSRTVGAVPHVWLGLPMIVANKLIGVLAVENEQDPDAFGERDIELLKTMTGPLAIAIHNLIQFEEVQTALEAQSQQRIQLQTAAEVAAATTSILELDELMDKAVNLISRRFTLYYVGLFLIDPGTNQAVLQAGTGKAGRIQLEKGHELRVGGRSLIGGATSDGQPRITQDVSQDEEWLPNPHLPQTRSELALPLRVRGRVIGALTVQSTTPNAFGPELVSTLQTMSDQLAVTIENARLLAETETRAQRQQFLHQISTRLHRSADVDEIVTIGLQALSKRLSGTKKVELRIGKTNSEDSKEQPQDKTHV
jgi:GAF domain-containing protein